MKSLLYLMLIFGLLIIFRPTSLPETDRLTKITSTSILDLSNKARADNNLTPLILDRGLKTSSNCKLIDMLEFHYWSHSRAGLSLDDCFNLSNMSGSELLAKCQLSAERVIRDWLGSPSHRHALLNPSYHFVGISTGVDSQTGCSLVIEHLGK